MTRRDRRNFSPEFRLEAAQLVIDQHYTIAAAATAMNVGISTIDLSLNLFPPNYAAGS